MSRYEKLIAKLTNNPKNVDFKTIKQILLKLGYEVRNNGSSHFIFTKDGASPITIPYKRPVKQIYVKEVLKILEGENSWKKIKIIIWLCLMRLSLSL